MFEVIVYLFEHYMYDYEALISTSQSISAELEDAGFTEREIIKAFLWLDGWARHRESTDHLEEHLSANQRIYCAEEYHKLSSESIGFLMFLEQGHIITAKMRELILDRAMAPRNFAD